mmetsp:Transcript_8666/g.13724  ORF Transcript_8666/g.13724 Transcript_8666/m.13724 type:complete len:435 (+) Transcript_8666:580-1884(+)
MQHARVRPKRNRGAWKVRQLTSANVLHDAIDQIHDVGTFILGTGELNANFGVESSTAKRSDNDAIFNSLHGPRTDANDVVRASVMVRRNVGVDRQTDDKIAVGRPNPERDAGGCGGELGDEGVALGVVIALSMSPRTRRTDLADTACGQRQFVRVTCGPSNVLVCHGEVGGHAGDGLDADPLDVLDVRVPAVHARFDMQRVVQAAAVACPDTNVIKIVLDVGPSAIEEDSGRFARIVPPATPLLLGTVLTDGNIAVRPEVHGVVHVVQTRRCVVVVETDDEILVGMSDRKAHTSHVVIVLEHMLGPRPIRPGITAGRSTEATCSSIDAAGGQGPGHVGVGTGTGTLPEQPDVCGCRAGLLQAHANPHGRGVGPGAAMHDVPVLLVQNLSAQVVFVRQLDAQLGSDDNCAHSCNEDAGGRSLNTLPDLQPAAGQQ